MSGTPALRWRLGKVPTLIWAAGLAAAAAGVAAFLTDPRAVLLVMLALAVWVWAAREARRSVIAPSDAVGAEPVGLSELAPLIEALPDPALLIDADMRIAGSNGAARRQMQFEARGQFLTAVLRHPDVLEAVQAAVREGATSTVEYETTAGVEHHTRCYVAPLNWSKKHAALIVFHDQTSRISTERMRTDFVANASHELRTPLASLTLLVETLAGPARDDAAQRDRFLKMMQTQAERMRRLIDDLLSLSRIELDEHVPPTDRADLAAVAREVADGLAGVASERGVRIALNVPGERVLVVGERFQLAQVIQNLVDNAVKYSPSGGEVRVEVGAADDRDAVIAKSARRWADAGHIALLTPVAADRAYAFVRVEDSGRGIARRFLPRLGERFFRVEREMGDERGGTGLGLAIVKHIVNRHRGGLLVESVQGKGTAFAAYVELARLG